MDYDLILKSGFRRKDELEYILGITRMSFYKYTKGIVSPRPVIAERIAKLESVIKKLTEKNLLPLKSDVDEHKRKQLVEKVKVVVRSDK